MYAYILYFCLITYKINQNNKSLNRKPFNHRQICHTKGSSNNPCIPIIYTMLACQLLAISLMKQSHWDLQYLMYYRKIIRNVNDKLYLARSNTGELGYDGPLYDGFPFMTDAMLGPSPMHIKYVSYVYDGSCTRRTNFPCPIESVISKFACIMIYYIINCIDSSKILFKRSVLKMNSL